MNLWIEMAQKQIQWFHGDNKSFMKGLPGCGVPKQALLGCYGIFVKRGKIPKIEDLPEDQKKSLKSFAIEIADGRLKKVDDLIDLCRCLLAFEYLLN